MPLFPQYVFPEKLKAVSVNFDGAPGMGIHQLTKMIFELLFGEFVGSLTIAINKAANRTGININGFVRHALKLERLQVIFVLSVKT